MNLNFIELLSILQLIAIQNSSNGNNTKPQAIIGLVKFVFCTRLTKRQLIILSLILECTKKNTLRPLAQKGCAPLVYSVPEFGCSCLRRVLSVSAPLSLPSPDVFHGSKGGGKTTYAKDNGSYQRLCVCCNATKCMANLPLSCLSRMLFNAFKSFPVFYLALPVLSRLAFPRMILPCV